MILHIIIGDIPHINVIVLCVLSLSFKSTSKYQSKIWVHMLLLKKNKSNDFRAKFDEISILPKHIRVLRDCLQIYHSTILCVKNVGYDCTKVAQMTQKIIVESCKQNQLLPFLPLKPPPLEALKWKTPK